jgi:hypothetical protein
MSQDFDEVVMSSGGTLPAIGDVLSKTTGTLDLGGRIELEAGPLYEAVVEDYDTYIIPAPASGGDCTSAKGYRLYAGIPGIFFRVTTTNRYISHLSVSGSAGTLKIFKREPQSV